MMDHARKAGTVTQLGNQGHSSEHIRLFCEWVWDGAIGDVTEVHAACSAFYNAKNGGLYSQLRNIPKMKEKHDVPAHLADGAEGAE